MNNFYSFYLERLEYYRINNSEMEEWDMKMCAELDCDSELERINNGYVNG
jgi:hypothetical protein